MKLLLTDSGVKNASILAALVDLLGKPIANAGSPGSQRQTFCW